VDEAKQAHVTLPPLVGRAMLSNICIRRLRETVEFFVCLIEDMMLTDASPRKANRAGFSESDRIRTLDLPQDGRWLTISQSIKSAMKSETTADVRRACAEFLGATSEFYKVPACCIRVLAARPLRVREQWTSELFGDYTPETMLIRVWMRTAVRKEVTSFPTFLSTLCHEFCHHLDY